MRQLWYKFLSVGLLTVVVSVSLVLAGNGKISGTVKGADGAAVVGANIVIEGTTMGGSADVSGNYFILNVPPGTYRLRGSAVGYAASVITGVRVGSDQIVNVNFTLQDETVGISEVVIQAIRPPVDKSQTSAKSTMSGDDFTALPINDVASLVSTSASTYKGFVRGGKTFETKTIVEGIDLTDQYYAFAAEASGLSFGAGGGTVSHYQTYNGVNRQIESQRATLVNLNVNAVEEANLLTGGVGADYSNATAGVVAYSLRDAREDLQGRVDIRVSQFSGLNYIGPDLYWDQGLYFTEKARLLANVQATEREKGARFTWSPDKYETGKPEYKAEASLGKKFGENTGAFLTLGWYDSHGRLPAEYTRRANLSLKVNSNLADNLKLTFIGLMEDRGKLLGWKNRSYMDDYRYFLEGVPRWDGANFTGALRLTYVVSPSTFAEFQVSAVNDNSRRGYSDDNGDGYCDLYEQGDFLTFADTAQVNRYMANNSNSQMQKFFSPSPRNESYSESGVTMSGAANWKIARPGIYYEDFTNSNVTVKADFTSQINENHQLRGGLQARMHNFDMIRRAGFIGGNVSSYKNYVEETWNLKPNEYGGYVQDRMEYAGLIINLGFRVDALDLAASDWANAFAPYTLITEEGGGKAQVSVRGATPKMKWFFSPRLGVSHPISDRAAMYFSFSQQSQSQPFSRLFANYNQWGNPSIAVLPRVEQDPIKSSSYELGLQYAFYENFSLDVSAYYKDIQNYGVTTLQVTPRSSIAKMYQINTAFGYADSRGVEVTVRRNLLPVADWLSIGGRVSYAYSYVKQAVPAGANVNAYVQADSAKYNGGLPWGDIKYWGTIEQHVNGGNTSVTGGYDRAHRIGMNLMFRMPYDVMLSAVGVFQSGFYYPLTLADPRSRAVGEAPWTKRVDLRIEKGFKFEGIGRFAVYVDVMNAFDWTNIVAYQQSSTATVPQIAWETTNDPTGGPTIQRSVTQDGSTVYDVPREIYFGLSYQF